MIVYKDPVTGYMCKCSLASSVPSGVPFRSVSSHERDEFNEAITDYDASGNPIFDIQKASLLKISEANRRCEEHLKFITASYSEAEMKTWIVQELEASNFQYDVDNLVDPKRATPNLDWIIMEKDGLPVDDAKRQALVTRILGKALAFHQASATAVGRRHKMAEAATATATIEELKTVVF